MTARRVVVLLLAAGMALIGPLLIVMTGSTVWNDLSKARRQFEIKNMKDTYGLAQNDVVASAHERKVPTRYGSYCRGLLLILLRFASLMYRQLC
eukprot:m.190318 g.190318  ORF g.190318 m.190318 type:complete len:94 (+) comp39431_c0_seq34:107-388(+)